MGSISHVWEVILAKDDGMVILSSQYGLQCDDEMILIILFEWVSSEGGESFEENSVQLLPGLL